MGMIGNYKRITPEQLAELQKKPESITAFIFTDDDTAVSAERYLNIDKSWHGIHFLLTGTVASGEPPLANAVLGGMPLGLDNPEFDYSPARFLTPDEVQEVAEALSQISDADLQARFNYNALSAADIYPDIWESGSGELEYLMWHYVPLVKFFQEAANCGDAMLLYIT